MPTYDYKCKSCGHTWELFQSMKDKPVKACPNCGKKTAERLIGTGAALLFKGSGFYQTDYRSEGYKKAADADKKSVSGEGVSGNGKTETKNGNEGTVAPTPKPAADASKPKRDAAPSAPKTKKKGGE